MEAVAVQKLNYEDFKDKFGESWAPRFRPFIEGKEMWDIYQHLKNEKELIVPKSNQTFRAFQTTEFGNIKVIFYLMDPYPRLYGDKTPQATGIAMDCSNSKDGKLQPSLIKWYDAIDKEFEHEERKDLIKQGKKVNRTPDLTYLHEQGVMMLNTDLTCKVNKTLSHKGLWEPFQKYFLEEVMRGTTGVIYVLCGKESLRMKRFINPLGNYIIELEHPAYAGRTGTDWDSKGIFRVINKTLFENNGPQSVIYWDKDDWDFYKDPPF